MNNAGIILLVNLAIAGLFCASFGLIATYDSRHRYAGWFAAAFAMGMIYVVLEYFLLVFNDPGISFIAGHLAFLLALALLNVGLAYHYAVRPPFYAMAAIIIFSLVAVFYVQHLPRSSFLRNALYQSPFFLMQSVSVFIVARRFHARSLRSRPAENLLIGLLGLNALQYLSKPFLVIALGGSGITPRDYIYTPYAMVSQSMGTILMVATALLMLAILIVDIVKDITVRLETDLLSGLINRRSFEEQLDQAIRDASVSGMTMTLVVCDLDSFKMINDSWGHAAGDKVIAAFANTLRQTASIPQTAARIGGEEFAILLPGSNLAAGRLFAEAARSAFANQSIEGFPEEKRFTASFGVAEYLKGETPASLAARADEALYDAKRTGRDRVRIALAS